MDFLVLSVQVWTHGHEESLEIRVQSWTNDSTELQKAIHSTLKHWAVCVALYRGHSKKVTRNREDIGKTKETRRKVEW